MDAQAEGRQAAFTGLIPAKTSKIPLLIWID